MTSGMTSSAGQAPSARSTATDFQLTDLQAPTPAPAQVFAIGLNYRDHAVESNLAVPDTFPPVFTKFRTALSGPITTDRAAIRRPRRLGGRARRR